MNTITDKKLKELFLDYLINYNSMEDLAKDYKLSLVDIKALIKKAHYKFK